MKIKCFLLFLSIGMFFGCSENQQDIPRIYQTGTEIIQNMVNNSLIASDELAYFVDTRNDGGSTNALRMILDYNNINNREEFERRIDDIENHDLKRRLLILLENM